MNAKHEVSIMDTEECYAITNNAHSGSVVCC